MHKPHKVLDKAISSDSIRPITDSPSVTYSTASPKSVPWDIMQFASLTQLSDDTALVCQIQHSALDLSRAATRIPNDTKNPGHHW
jgi:hypothetical protein